MIVAPVRRNAILVVPSEVEGSRGTILKAMFTGWKARPRPAIAGLRYGLDSASLRSE